MVSLPLNKPELWVLLEFISGGSCPPTPTDNTEPSYVTVFFEKFHSIHEVKGVWSLLNYLFLNIVYSYGLCMLTGLAAKILLCFSLYTNGGKILSTEQPPGAITCLHGIRFLSMTWVILGHSGAFSVLLLGKFALKWCSNYFIISIWPLPGELCLVSHWLCLPC